MTRMLVKLRTTKGTWEIVLVEVRKPRLFEIDEICLLRNTQIGKPLGIQPCPELPSMRVLGCEINCFSGTLDIYVEYVETIKNREEHKPYCLSFNSEDIQQLYLGNRPLRTLLGCHMKKKSKDQKETVGIRWKTANGVYEIVHQPTQKILTHTSFGKTGKTALGIGKHPYMSEMQVTKCNLDCMKGELYVQGVYATSEQNQMLYGPEELFWQAWDIAELSIGNPELRRLFGSRMKKGLATAPR